MALRQIRHQFRMLFKNRLFWLITLIVAVALVAGRALGVALMFSSIILLSLFTATVSSIFVAKKIQEAKGLELGTFENHILVCGWNEHALRTLERLNAQGDARDVVLINQLAPEDMEAVVSSYSNLEVRFT